MEALCLIRELSTKRRSASSAIIAIALGIVAFVVIVYSRYSPAPFSGAATGLSAAIGKEHQDSIAHRLRRRRRAWSVMSFAAVPAYRAFCQVTGWGGDDPARGQAAADVQGAGPPDYDSLRCERRLRRLPWRFRPEQLTQTLNIGESGLAYLRGAESFGSASCRRQRASFNVSRRQRPGKYFKKIECFLLHRADAEIRPRRCLNARSPISSIRRWLTTRTSDDVSEVTLSYTFFRLGTTAPGVVADGCASAAE